MSEDDGRMGVTPPPEGVGQYGDEHLDLTCYPGVQEPSGSPLVLTEEMPGFGEPWAQIFQNTAEMLRAHGGTYGRWRLDESPDGARLILNSEDVEPPL